jgi:hypothetical protein
MLKGNFEVSLPEPVLTGEVYGTVYEVAGAQPTTIIRTDQEWGVKLHWDLKGPLAKFICGEWCIHLFLESIGKGPELNLDPYPYQSIPLDPCGDGEYNFDFRVQPGKVTSEHCSTPYKLVAAITYVTPCGKPGPISGFLEGPILQFYEPS